ncbi:MAG: hypothetical protein U5K74_13955 [Gemmatimonadaceae bacterium]|nr:hypothetical protein [Gemmatimonadaceae bacterium]
MPWLEDVHLVHDPIGKSDAWGHFRERLDVQNERTEGSQFIAAFGAIAQMTGELLRPNPVSPSRSRLSSSAGGGV